MTQHARHGLFGYLPNAEVAQHMVYAHGIKVLRQMAQALSKHGIQGVAPAVGGISPIVSLRREIVWRRSCLTVQMEQLWMLLDLNAIRMTPDRQIAHQRHTLLAGIVGSSFQLTVQ